MKPRVLLVAICLTATCLFLAVLCITSVQGQTALTSATTPPTEKWEYCKLMLYGSDGIELYSARFSSKNQKDVYEEFKVSSNLELRNKLGSEGWELVGISHCIDVVGTWTEMYMFKRRLPRE